MPELVIKIPDDLEKEVREFPLEKFVVRAVEEKLAEMRLERSKAFRKLLVEIFNRMTENSKLSDEDCLKLGREVNEALAKRYGLTR